MQFLSVLRDILFPTCSKITIDVGYAWQHGVDRKCINHGNTIHARNQSSFTVDSFLLAFRGKSVFTVWKWRAREDRLTSLRAMRWGDRSMALRRARTALFCSLSLWSREQYYISRWCIVPNVRGASWYVTPGPLAANKIIVGKWLMIVL